MSAWTWRTVGILLAVVLVLVAGAALGGWMASRHYRPLLDTAQADLATAKAGRYNLEALAGEQGRKLGELTQVAHARQARAEQAVEQARLGAQIDYAAANRLQQERTGGDLCAAATTIIDKELGL